MKEKILVIGGTGFIGLNILKRLSKKKILSLLYFKKESNLFKKN